MIMMACDVVRQRRQLRRLMRHEIASLYRTLTAECAQRPAEASDMRVDDGGGLCAVSDRTKAAVMVKSFLTAFCRPKAYLCK